MSQIILKMLNQNVILSAVLKVFKKPTRNSIKINVELFKTNNRSVK
jgi:hypothetical protein